MRIQGIWIALLVAGIGLVFISWFWPSIAGGKQRWSDAQAKEYTDTLLEYHRLNGELAQVQDQLKQQAIAGSAQKSLADSRLANSAATGAPVDPSTASADRLATELDAAKVRYQKQLAALDEARSQGARVATLLRWLGIVLAAVGLIGMFGTRSQTG